MKGSRRLWRVAHEASCAMKAAISSLTLLVIPCAVADELYEFYLIQCVKPLSAVVIEPVSVWNIGEFVWPGTPAKSNRSEWMKTLWEKHEQNLKHLEEKYDLYVFNEAYGRYVDEPITCTAPTFRLSVSAEPIARDYVNRDDIQVPYRGVMKVKIESIEGHILFQQEMHRGSSLRVSVDELEVCDSETDHLTKRTVSCRKRSLFQHVDSHDDALKVSPPSGER